jgi:hypothetical protein
MFCAPELVFGGAKGVSSRFYVFRSRTCFQRDRGRRVPFSFFAHPDSFSAVPRASNPVFMFSTPGHVFGDTEGVKSRFHIFRSRLYFRRYREREISFSYFALPDTFSEVQRSSGPFFMFCAPEFISAVPRALGHVLMFCAPGLIFGGTEGVGSLFHVLRAGLIFSGTEDVRSRFHVLRSRTCFQRYRGRRVPFSCFACSESFSAVPRASGPVFMFSAP